MLEPIYPKTFRKQYRLMKKRGMNIDKLLEVMKMIINEKPLPPERCNHPLHGNWEGSFECHIQGDWVLIYFIYSIPKRVPLLFNAPEHIPICFKFIAQMKKTVVGLYTDGGRGVPVIMR